MSNFPENDFRLFVLVFPFDRDSIRSAGNRAGDKQQVADAESVGPPSRRWFGNVGATNSFDLHLCHLSFLSCGLRVFARDHSGSMRLGFRIGGHYISAGRSTSWSAVPP